MSSVFEVGFAAEGVVHAFELYFSELPERLKPYAIAGTTGFFRTRKEIELGTVTEVWERYVADELEHRFTLRFPEAE